MLLLLLLVGQAAASLSTPGLQRLVEEQAATIERLSAELRQLREATHEPRPSVCVVAGVGPGIGEHVARRFSAGGCRVALLARNATKLANISKHIPGSVAFPCDVTDAKAVASTFASIHASLGAVDALLYNVGGGRFAPFDAITGDDLTLDFQTNALGLLLTSQQVAPGMAARGRGVIGVTGATSAWRSTAHTAGFAPGKFAARALAESLARQLGPKGVHVFHAVIDGGVAPYSPPSANTSMLPGDIAETYWNLAVQPRSAWTFELSMYAWADPLWYTI